MEHGITLKVNIDSMINDAKEIEDYVKHEAEDFLNKLGLRDFTVVETTVTQPHAVDEPLQSLSNDKEQVGNDSSATDSPGQSAADIPSQTEGGSESAEPDPTGTASSQDGDASSPGQSESSGPGAPSDAQAASGAEQPKQG